MGLSSSRNLDYFDYYLHYKLLGDKRGFGFIQSDERSAIVCLPKRQKLKKGRI